MIDYNNGKIYTIRSHQTVGFYIGSTIQPLCKRLEGHKKAYKQYLKDNNKQYCSSYEILKFDDCYIELLENFSCENRDELHKREGEMIRLNIDVVVNKCIPGRTDKEWRIDNKEKIRQNSKQHYETNKEKIRQNSKQHYENNKEHYKEKFKQYQIDNKEKLKEQKKQYYENNKEHINEQIKEKQKQYQRQYRQKQKALNNTTAPATIPTTV